MKAMIFSDLITSKRSCIQLIMISLFVGVVISIGMNALVAATAALSAMIPLMFLFSISAYDEMNGWERFRLTLPITRHQVAYGRYASMLIISASALVFSLIVTFIVGWIAGMLPADIVPEGILISAVGAEGLIAAAVISTMLIILVAALVLPVIMRYGVTKGSRLVPVICVLGLLACMVFFNNYMDLDEIEAWLMGAGYMLPIVIAVLVVAILLIYAGSAVLSSRLYMNREL